MTHHDSLLLDQIILNNGKTIRLVKGDITERNVDVIVNPANSYLKHGGGVAAAIVKKGGQIIQEESDKIGYVPVGSAVVTDSGKLPCKAVIHTVGPQMGEGNEDEKLRKAIISVLALAHENGFKSISIPAISTGIFGYPKEKCAEILLKESMNYFAKIKDKSRSPSTIDIIEFSLVDSESMHYFKCEMKKLKHLPRT
ncbi:MAG TPA: macro domain-containing protein [Nitrososphaeraceae archaeon]|jgi:O-acetyl-ADP-ribose deacetylase (regulator of RNase III)